MKKKALFMCLLFALAGVLFAACYPTRDRSGNDGTGGNPPGPVVRGSAGCGNRSFSPSGTYNINVNGVQRKYIVTPSSQLRSR